MPTIQQAIAPSVIVVLGSDSSAQEQATNTIIAQDLLSTTSVHHAVASLRVDGVDKQVVVIPAASRVAVEAGTVLACGLGESFFYLLPENLLLHKVHCKGEAGSTPLGTIEEGDNTASSWVLSIQGAYLSLPTTH